VREGLSLSEKRTGAINMIAIF
jgi:hypothetical protein